MTLSPTRVVSGTAELSRLGAHLRELGVERPFVISGPNRRFVDEATAALGPMDVVVFDGAAVHVPKAVVAQAEAALAKSDCDVIVAIGGGAAVGLGKALRLSHDLAFVAVPTTYAGSEMTKIWGVTDGQTKRTGRDERVRPQLVIHDPALPAAMPAGLALQSLTNALAHPVSVLAKASAASGDWDAALEAVGFLVRAITALLVSPDHLQLQSSALKGAAAAGRVLDAGEVGAQHTVAHVLGGRFGAPHAALHSILLPAFLADLRRHKPGHFDAIARAAGQQDLVALLHDALRAVGCATSLRDLGISWSDATAALRAQDVDELEFSWVQDAYLGRRRAAATRQVDWVEDGSANPPPPATLFGPPLADAKRVVIALHGRGSNADAIVQRVREIIGDAPDVAVVAPQADEARWYDSSYRDAAGTPQLDAALATTAAVLARVRAEVPADRIVLFGFSQGACLALETAVRIDAPLGAVIALSGARVGADEWVDASPHMAGVPVLLGLADEDRWVSITDLLRTADHLTGGGAEVHNVSTTGDAHEITARQRIAAREMILGAGQPRFGLGNAFDVETLPGALPRSQNSPRRVPYGLSAEQVNGSGFVAPRSSNVRSWLYRLRPVPGHSRYEPLAHRTFRSTPIGTPPEPNLFALNPLANPDLPTDFIDGMHTVGGAGDASLRRGYAVHMYAANRSMENRAFYNGDGDTLLLPQQGALTLLTELGSLRVAPGEIALVPQGFRFSVLLDGKSARGYAAEVFGRHFRLPDRGPVGANGLADARHFRAPTPYCENRPAPGFTVTAKLGGALSEYTQGHSPFDVAAWHGNYAPMTYDLANFCPVAGVGFDHTDPSAFTVLSAPLDEPGDHTLDLVLFPPRWDATEHTFRPPFMHRSATMEFNGILGGERASKGMFKPGMAFVTPPMTAHGIVASSVDQYLGLPDDEADKPSRQSGGDTVWFQFESALPMSLTEWARNAPERVEDWNERWGVYSSHYSGT